MKRLNKYYEKARDGLVSTVSGMALDKFAKSEYLRDMTSILPLTLLTTLIRGTFNFLITSRLQTNIYLLDFISSITITITLTLSSPYIYNAISRGYEAEIKNFSQKVIDSYWEQGWSFIEIWKTRIFGSVGFGAIILLFFVEVNSKMIQEFIFHTMISSIIVEHLNNLRGGDIHIEERDIKEKDVIVKITQPFLIHSHSYKNLIYEEVQNEEDIKSKVKEKQEIKKEEIKEEIKEGSLKNSKTFKFKIVEDYNLVKSSYVDMNIFDESEE